MAVRAKRKSACIAFMLVQLLALAGAVGETFATEDVSIIALIANPLQYHEKKIRVIGFASIDWESQEVFLSKGDAEIGITKNALRMVLSRDDAQKYKDKHWEYVVVEGVYDGTFRGFGDSYSGAIREITRLEEWRLRTGAK